jgi:hypothetical protein
MIDMWDRDRLLVDGKQRGKRRGTSENQTERELSSAEAVGLNLKQYF